MRSKGRSRKGGRKTEKEGKETEHMEVKQERAEM